MESKDLVVPLREWQLMSSDGSFEGAKQSNYYDGLPPDVVLIEFIKRVRQGAPISDKTLQLIADGVERHLINKDCNPWPMTSSNGGRPINECPSSDTLRKAAEIQFYRVLWPEFDKQKKPIKKAALAAQFNCTEKTINNWEHISVPSSFDWQKKPTKKDPYSVFSLRITELIQQNNLDGVVYCYGKLLIENELDQDKK